MTTRDVAEVADGVYWVGARDWSRRVFDALIPLPRGTTYNAYLVVGESAVALVDTVNPGFERDLEEKVRQVVDPGDITYVVMNHAEPDHAGAIPHVMAMAPDAKLVTSPKGANMARTFYRVPDARIKSVSDGETISLGGKTLQFIEAPMLHWPETMFTYLRESGVLFSCDFFGAHVAHGLFDDEVKDLPTHAQRYFGEIMMPFRAMGAKALEKLRDLEINVIAPSHGPIYRNPRRILDLYAKWTRGETEEKVVVIYVSMWGSTERMALNAAEALTSEGVEVVVYNLAVADVGDVARDLVDARGLVLASPAVLGGAHPLAMFGAHLVRALRPSAKFVAVLSSYGWGKGAVRAILDALKGAPVEVVGQLEVNGPPTDEDLNKVTELARALAARVRGQ